MTSRLINKNVTTLGGRTSMRLEPEMWKALEEICHRENMTLADLIQEQDKLCSRRVTGIRNTGKVQRTSWMRTYILTYFQNAATEEGHKQAGHGELNQVVN